MEVYEMAAKVSAADVYSESATSDKHIEEVLDAIQDGEITDAASDESIEQCDSLVDVTVDLSDVPGEYVERAISEGLIDTSDYDSNRWAMVAEFVRYQAIMAEVIEDLEEKIEDLPPEPEDEDYVLQDSGPLGTKTVVAIAGHGFIGEYASEDDALDAIRAMMEEHRFYPSVWKVSDHGNYTELEV